MLDTFPEDARACDFTACWPFVTCWTPRPREHAALCNDLGDSEVRKHEDETPAKTRHPDDCEVTQTGSFRGCTGARQLPLTPFGSPSSHKASGIVRLEGDQTPSRQLFGSSRFGRVRPVGSGGRAAPGRHGAHRAMHEARPACKPGQPPREGHSRGCLFEVARRSRTSALTRAPRRSPPTVNRRSRHPRAAPTRTKLVAFDRWFFRGGP